MIVLRLVGRGWACLTDPCKQPQPGFLRTIKRAPGFRLASCGPRSTAPAPSSTMLPRAARAAAPRRQGLLGRPFAVGEKVVDRRARRAGEVDAGGAELGDRAAEFLRLGQIARPAAWAAGGRRASPSSEAPAPRRACRDRRTRSPPVRGYGARRARRGAWPACGAGAARWRAGPAPVVRARRKRRPLPAPVARPAADAGVAHAGAGPDLPIGERALLDQAAHRRERGVGVRLAVSRAPRRHYGVGSVGVGPDADPGQWETREGGAHAVEYSPRYARGKGAAGVRHRDVKHRRAASAVGSALPLGGGLGREAATRKKRSLPATPHPARMRSPPSPTRGEGTRGSAAVQSNEARLVGRPTKQSWPGLMPGHDQFGS